MKIAVLCVSILLGGSLAATAMDENELLLKVRAAEANAEGAATESKQRIAQKLVAEIDGASIEVLSGVVKAFREGGSLANGYAFHFSPSGIAPSQRRITSTLAIVTKSYQDRTLEYFVPIESPSLLDDFRLGQKVSFSGRIFSVGTPGIVINRSLALWVGLIGVEVKTETRVLRCPNGHEYAPSAGFKFCPQDGLSLK